MAQEAENIKRIHWTGVEFTNGDILDLTNVIGSEEVEKILDTRKQMI